MKQSILYVDETQDNLARLQRALRWVHHDLQVATSGIEGLNIALQERPALILMDTLLPDMRGWEAATLIKTHPHLYDIPIVALISKWEDADLFDCCQRYGCVGFIDKPLSQGKLLKVVRQFIR